MKYVVVQTTQVVDNILGIPMTQAVYCIHGIFSTQELAETYIESRKESGVQDLYWNRILEDKDIIPER